MCVFGDDLPVPVDRVSCVFAVIFLVVSPVIFLVLIFCSSTTFPARVFDNHQFYCRGDELVGDEILSKIV
jgi:hypothetical protein